jgi:trehalose 6-phosphate synthase
MTVLREHFQKLIKEKLGDYRFIVVSNRQPYIHVLKKGKVEWQRGPGGVVAALDPLMQACNGMWLALSTGDADHQAVDQNQKVQVPPDQPAYTLKRIFLNKEEEEGYYYGYSNDALWPLCHMAFQRPAFRQKDWEQYCQVNQKFAKAVMEEVGQDKAFVWIHDYHLCLLPKYLKQLSANNLIIAHFWHIPWPSFEGFRICPNKNELLDGLLANDLLGFHTHYDCYNFLDAVDRLIESKIDRERFSVIRSNHETIIRPYPISVDFDGITALTQSQEVQQLSLRLREEHSLLDKKLLIGVDRIDYTKGIPERLLALDRLLDKHPELQEKIVFIQVGVISRLHLQKYKSLNDEINALVERVNWKHSTPLWSPIIFFRRNLPLKELLALYRIADVCIVSSLHDGMNLVAKEFISSRYDERGVLVLSQFTGSARELKDAILINPFDQEEASEGLYQAIALSEEESCRRMKKMRQVIAENTIFHWAQKMLKDLLKIEFDVER